MDHAEVRDRLADALLAPGGLDALRADPGPEAVRVREHLAGCDACRGEAEALATTGALLAVASPDDLAAPPDARARILAAVRGTGTVRPVRTERPAVPVTSPSGGGRPWRVPRLLAPLAAAGAVIALAGGMLLVADLAGQRDRAQAQLAALVEVATASGQVLAEPDHGQLALQTPAGQRGGTLLFGPTSGQLVVWSRALEPPRAGERYDCYLELAGQRTLVGWMHQAGEMAYWVGEVPAGTPVGIPGQRFLVVSGEDGGTPVLSGTF